MFAFVGSFLSKGASLGYVLAQIILEAIILLENADYQCDAVVTDAGSWNRNMWNQFFNADDEVLAGKVSEIGTTGSKKGPQQSQRNSTEHPFHHNRRLYFVSDFPHLMKTLWSYIVSKNEIKVIF